MTCLVKGSFATCVFCSGIKPLWLVRDFYTNIKYLYIHAVKTNIYEKEMIFLLNLVTRRLYKVDCIKYLRSLHW
jgi:hypothetical protein